MAIIAMCAAPASGAGGGQERVTDVTATVCGAPDWVAAVAPPGCVRQVATYTTASATRIAPNSPKRRITSCRPCRNGRRTRAGGRGARACPHGASAARPAPPGAEARRGCPAGPASQARHFARGPAPSRLSHRCPRAPSRPAAGRSAIRTRASPAPMARQPAGQSATTGWGPCHPCRRAVLGAGRCATTRSAAGPTPRARSPAVLSPAARPAAGRCREAAAADLWRGVAAAGPSAVRDRPADWSHQAARHRATGHRQASGRLRPSRFPGPAAPFGPRARTGPAAPGRRAGRTGPVAPRCRVRQRP